MVPVPPSKGKTNRLMQLADMLVVTGSQIMSKQDTHQAPRHWVLGKVMWLQ